MPSCPFPNITLVEATLSPSLRTVAIRSNVGKLENSSGLCVCIATISINSDNKIFVTKKVSNKEGGNGKTIIATNTKIPIGNEMLANSVLKFLCHDLNVIVQDTLPSPFTWGFKPTIKLNIPIAHNEGNYYINDNELKKLKFNGQIAFKYEERFNPNGSVENIAGVLSENGRILGMMPHPERSVFDHHNSLDGKLFFQNLMEQLLS